MSFKFIRDGDYALSSEVNANFYWLGQGSVLPMSGNNLNNGGSANLGNTSAAWDTIYCDNVQTCGSSNYLYLKSYVSLTEASESIELTGLENNSLFKIIINARLVENTYQIVSYNINGISTTSYAYDYQYGHNAATQREDTIGTYMEVYRHTGLTDTAHKFFFIESSGYNRSNLVDSTIPNITVLSKGSGLLNYSISVGTNPQCHGIGKIHNGSLLTLSSIKITVSGSSASFDAGTKIWLYVIDRDATNGIIYSV